MEQQNQQSTQEKIESKPPIKTNWKYIVIVVVLALVMGGGIWSFSYSLKTESQLPQIKISTPQPPPRPSQEIDTSTWQTYRNEEFGFEVRYPRDWVFEENGISVFLSKNDVSSRTNPDPHFHTFSMGIKRHTANDTLEAYLKRRFNLKNLAEFKITPEESGYYIDWLKTTTLGGDIQSYFIHEWVQAFSICHFFTQNNNMIIEITRDGRYNCLDDPQFSQILSTFRFAPTTN